jgi:hypothetical protein
MISANQESMGIGAPPQIDPALSRLDLDPDLDKNLQISFKRAFELIFDAKIPQGITEMLKIAD